MSYVYDMTWAEFCIRAHAYDRQDKKQWYKVREIAYYSMIGSHLDSKKVPKTKEIFMPLDEKKKISPTEFTMNAIKEARENYQRELKEKHNE